MTATDDAATAAVTPDPRRWKALAVLALIQFMLILDVTVVNIALPKVQADLDFSRAGLAWVVNGYVLMAGGLLLLGGRLADILGRRKLFLWGVALFAVASAACGAAVSSEMLVASRFLQGAGEALAAPASLGLIALLFPDPKERMKALGVWGGIAGLGGTSGTVISGALVDLVSWRWIFFINLPVALFALLVVPRLVSESRMTREGHGRVDYTGAVTATAGLIAIVYGILQAAEHAWGSVNVVLPIVAGIALLVIFTYVESRTEAPLIPLKFFENRTRVVTNGVTLFFSSAFFSYFFLLTLWEQQIHGWSPLRAGLSYLPFGIAISAGIGIGTVLMPKFGVKPIFTVGFFGCAVGLFLTSMIDTASTYPAHVLPGMIVLGLASGLSFPAISNAALHKVTGQDASLASGVQNAFQQIGGALGLSFLVTFGLRHAESAIRDGVAAPEAFTDGYQLAYRIGTVLLTIGGILVLVFLEHVNPNPRQPEAEVDGEPLAVTPSGVAEVP